MVRFAVAALVVVAVSVAAPKKSHGFGYIFAGDANGIDVVTHPSGYTGTGGTLNVTVGIDPGSAFAAQMVVSVQNVINTFNNLVVTTGNFQLGAIGFTQYDFESVLLHELGHSLGLSHTNVGFVPGPTAMDPPEVDDPDTDFTYSTRGGNGVFDFDDGVDNIIGTADDIRGDDVNLNYFKTVDNNPFTIAGTVDSTTYSRDLADLPMGDNYSANSGRDVSAALGFANTEGVMQQGSFNSEIQRTLAADDVAGILYAASGLDEIAGTADDYTLDISYAGMTTSADIVIAFDNTETGFAVSKSDGFFIGSPTNGHVRVNTSEIYFNDGFNWYFNETSNAAVPEPSSLAVLGIGTVVAGISVRRRRAKASAKKSA